MSDDSDDREDYTGHLDGALQVFGRFLFADGAADDSFVPVGSRTEAIGAVEAIFAGPLPRASVLLGVDGVGRSALLLAAAARLAASGHRIFEASASSVLAGQRYIGEVEERLQAIALAGLEKPLVWLLPDLAAAAGAGSYHGDPRGMLERLAPFVASGEIRLLGDAEPRAWAAVLQQRPMLRGIFQPVRLEPLTPDESAIVVREWLAARDAAIEPSALGEAVQLADQFLPQVAYPGRLLRIVFAAYQKASQDGHEPVELRAHHLVDGLAETTGLPLALLDHRQKLDVDALHAFFEGQVLGQPEPVDAIVERVTMIKAGLTDPTRPLGVLLFVGPTGTGKTELAKALATYLFGSPERLLRLDMSEYQTPDSLERLLAGPDSVEGADLVRTIRRQPFSVVLLDEFEKAHPNIWDVFLQLFDDGRLTDRSGDTADFRHAVVILTSNLGAAAQQAGRIGFGPSESTFSPAAIERQVAAVFRPEFVNRLDRTIVFRPLSREVMRSIVTKELGEIVQRRGLRTRPWAIEWDESAIDVLLEQGFSPELGARPLKRAIETHLLVPLARTIVEHKAPEGEQFLFVRSRDGREIDVEFVDPDSELGPPPPGPARGPVAVVTVAAEPAGTAAEARFLEQELRRLGDELAHGELPGRKEQALLTMADPGFWDREDRFALLDDVETIDRIEAGLGGASSLLRRLGASQDGERTSPRMARLLALRIYLLQAALAALEAGEPSDAFLAVQADPEDPEARAFATRISGMYRAWASERGMHLTDVEDAAGGADVGVLALSGFGAYSILRDECGLHMLETDRGERPAGRVVVRVVVAPRPSEPVPPRALRNVAAQALDGEPRSSTVVRRYREEPSPLVRDAVRGWRTGRLERVLAGDFDLQTP